MSRVTYSQVIAIMGDEAEDATESDITPFITVAGELVTELLVDKGLSVERLALIEMWLAAHLACVKIKRVKSETVKSIANTYQDAEGRRGVSYMATMFGQTAVTLDTSGTLSKNARLLEKGLYGVTPDVITAGLKRPSLSISQ